MQARQLALAGLTACALAVPTAHASAAAPAASCVGQFITTHAPHSSGDFGALTSDVARTVQPNFGLGDVTVFARAPHNDCPT